MLHLVAYDIANPDRLRRVARRMERSAVRLQKSVFLFRGDTDAVEALLDELVPLLELEHDVVTAWKLAAAQSPQGSSRGNAGTATPAGVVLGPVGSLFVKQPSP